MLRKIRNLFRHRCKFEFSHFIYHSGSHPLSAAPCTAKVYRCKCGKEKRELTPAGYQQLSWGEPLEEVLGYND